MARVFRSLRRTLAHHLHHHHQRLLLPQFTRRTYISEMRNEAFEGNMLRLLRREIQYELQSSSLNQPITKFNSFVVNGRPGERWITLKRQYADEDIKVEVTMFDGEAPAPTKTASGGAVVNADDVQLHITLIVSISKGDGSVLEFMCSAWPDTIEINRLFTRSMIEPAYGGSERLIRQRRRRRESAAMCGGRTLLRLFSQQQRLRFLRMASFSTDTKNTPSCNSSSNNAKNKNDIVSVDERYKMLENLDMMTAAKILFTDPPKKKKFGLDFHLVQLFFACLPSLAVFLVAQYARYDMRKMEAEVEQKKKQRDEEEAKKKEKEMELNPPEEKEAKSDPEIVEVKVRLEKLEEAVKEIVVESKKQSNTNIAKTQVIDDERKPLKSSTPSGASKGSQSNKAVGEDRLDNPNSPKSKPESGEESKSSTATPNSSPQYPKG